MDFGGFILLLVIVFVIAKIFFAKRNKKEKAADHGKVSEGAPAESAAHAAADASSAEKIPSDPPQNTIYEYCVTSRTRICPYCDGENRRVDNVCSICGRDI
jgi:hypothetical protein